MKLFNLKELSMWFHYGNCKQEIEKLKKENDDFLKQIPMLLSQIQEQKGILDYTMHEKEQEIERLKRDIEELTGISTKDDATKSIRDAWESGDMAKLRVAKKKEKK